ncbi:MAG: hypothetical protein RIB93_01950 [Coleofasciculus sp. D1-CHI-01]
MFKISEIYQFKAVNSHASLLRSELMTGLKEDSVRHFPRYYQENRESDRR